MYHPNRSFWQAGAFILLLDPSLLIAQGPSVQSVSPAPHSTVAAVSSTIIVDFDRPIDTSTVSFSTFRVCGHWSGELRGVFRFENNCRRVLMTPQRAFSAGELVSVFLGRDIRDSIGTAQAHGFAWTFWTRPQAGSLSLTEVARLPIRDVPGVHIQSYGAYGGDIDGDGWLDMLIPNERSNDVRVFRNDRLGMYGTFSIVRIPGGSIPSPNEGIDLNGDGAMDYVVGNTGNDSVSVFLGDGTGGFTSIRNNSAGTGVRGVAVFDADGDGDIDIATANRAASTVAVLLNAGDGSFLPRTIYEAQSSQETAIAASDMNGDGIMDLVVGGYGSNEMSILLGNGNGGFAFSEKRGALGKPWMIAVGDVNGDGRADVVSANSVSNNAGIFFGDGSGGFDTAFTVATGGFPLAIDLGDIDGDGDLDLVTSNYSGANWSVFRNPGNGLFTDRRNFPASRAGSCATLHDRDNDGDLDMSGIDEEDDLIVLFRNGPASGISPGAGSIPGDALLANYPNPFNGPTLLRFRVASPGWVSLTVHDVLGRTVARLVEGRSERGMYTTEWNAGDLPSGPYFGRLVTPAGSAAVRMMILR